MTKTEQSVERAVVTFFEAAIAYIIVIPSVSWGKTAIAGAIGAGLSAVYNVVRLSSPPPSEPLAEAPLNGVEQLTTPTTTQIPVVDDETLPVLE